MADFLTRLASRAMGLAPAAEPVVAPMFAPDPLVAAPDAAPEPFTAAPAVTQETTPPRLDMDAERDAPPRPPEESPAITHAPEASPRRPKPAHPPMLASVEVEGAHVQKRRVAPDQPGEPATMYSGPADAGEMLTSDALLLPRSGPPAEPAQPDRRDSPVDRAAAAGVRPRRRRAVSQDVIADEPLLMPLAPQEAGFSPVGAARQVAAVAPVDVAAPSRGGGSQQAVTPPASQPTIEITIGRVEVRAVAPPPASSPRPRPAAPGLSLEEYLRTQNRGGR